MSVLLLIWIALAIYGLWVQGKCLGYARANLKVAKPFGDISGVLIMAKARLYTNWVRMSIVAVNLAIGLTSVVFPPSEHPVTLTVIISFAFIFNEVAMLTIATREYIANRKLRKTNALYRNI